MITIDEVREAYRILGSFPCSMIFSKEIRGKEFHCPLTAVTLVRRNLRTKDFILMCDLRRVIAEEFGYDYSRGFMTGIDYSPEQLLDTQEDNYDFRKGRDDGVAIKKALGL